MQPSRSEQKRRAKQLEKLVEALSRLPAAVQKTIPCNDEIRGLLREASSLQGGAGKRLLKYITKLLRHEQDETLAELYDFLSRRQGPALQGKKEFHEIEYWRDALLNEAIAQRQAAKEQQADWEEDWPSLVAGQMAEQFPGIDRKALVRLAWLYAGTRNRKHSREIFRLLRAAQERLRYSH